MRNERIFVVDDEPESAQVVLAALMEIGFTNVTLYYGPDKLIYDYDYNNPPDLIISDFRMNPETGVEMFERIASETKGRKLPKMMLMSRFKVPLWQGLFFEKPFYRNKFISSLQASVLEIFQVSHLQ